MPVVFIPPGVQIKSLQCERDSRSKVGRLDLRGCSDEVLHTHAETLTESSFDSEDAAIAAAKVKTTDTDIGTASVHRTPDGKFALREALVSRVFITNDSVADSQDESISIANIKAFRKKVRDWGDDVVALVAGELVIQNDKANF
jgi:hypothetical protein